MWSPLKDNRNSIAKKKGEINMPKAAWIGLGAMGNPMAAYLSRHPEIELTIYNRTTAKAENWLNNNNGKLALSPREAGQDAAFVFSCIGNDDDLVEITTGEDGAFQTMPDGAIFIDHSTTSATVARSRAKTARQAGLEFLDAPVTGGQKGAEAGTLSIMVGGDETALEKAHPFINCYAKAINHMGPSGRGQQTKMVNQIAIAGIVEGLAEAINFAEKSQLDIEKVLAVISKGAARSWQMENSGLLMSKGQFDHGFAVDWMRKDLGICLEEAGKQGTPLPVTRLVEQYLADVQAMNGGRWDITSLIKRLDQKNVHEDEDHK